jgi:hypothetical protein
MVKEADAELIVQFPTTPNNLPDGVVLPALAQPQMKDLTGDKAYRQQNQSLPSSAHRRGPWLTPPVASTRTTPEVLAETPHYRKKVCGV